MESNTLPSDNELIAQFMGKGFKGDKDSFPETHAAWLAYLEYDASWDWLMPVVEKIENIRHIGIDAVYFQIKGHQAQIWTYFDVKEFLRMTGDDKNDGNKFKVGHSAKTKIEATYHACLDFIKWYNQQPKL